MMRVLGIDGGQSGIRLKHSDHPDAIEVAGVSRLEGDTVEAVADAIDTGWRRARFTPVERVVLGLTTAPANADDADRLCARVAETTGAREVWLADDTVTSHTGALSGGPGVSLIVGTGVACLALPDGGDPRVIDGHGFLLGDAGGGFWIGSRGLSAVLNARDGRGDDTELTRVAEQRFGDLDTLHIRLHGDGMRGRDSDHRPVNAIAQFAREVLELAGDDHISSRIVDQAADELLTTVRAGITWAQPRSPRDAQVPLALGGRLLGEETELRRRLDRLLTSEGITGRTAAASALHGAVSLGLSDNPTRYGTLIHRWKEGSRT